MVTRPAITVSETALRAMVLDFLALTERPCDWTFFQAMRPEGPDAGPAPDIVIDAGGRIAYVELCRTGGGPLPPPRAAMLAFARARGAPCFVVRSLPEMERVLRALGIRLRPRGQLIADGSPDRVRGGTDAR